MHVLDILGQEMASIPNIIFCGGETGERPGVKWVESLWGAGDEGKEVEFLIQREPRVI